MISAGSAVSDSSTAPRTDCSASRFCGGAAAEPPLRWSAIAIGRSSLGRPSERFGRSREAFPAFSAELLRSASLSGVSAEWEERLADLWAALDELDEEAFLARIDALTAERGDDDAIALFERGAARDSTGHSDLAVPLYQRALELGLEGERRRRAVIQMASSLREPRACLRRAWRC